MATVNILFVCMGNICRSPTAQGVFEKLLGENSLSERFVVDSAGTHAYHVGEPPDSRAIQAAQRRGIALDHQRARRVSETDFAAFDYVLAMDEENFAILSSICRAQDRSKLHLLMDFAPEAKVRDVPDPYYGGSNGFERVLDLIEYASHGLLESIRRQHRF